MNGNIISMYPSITTTPVSRVSELEESSLRNSMECIQSVMAARKADNKKDIDKAKSNNYYRMPNATLPEGQTQGVRCNEGVVSNGRVMLDYDVDFGGMEFYNDKIKGHEKELGIVHVELSARKGLHIDVRLIEGLSREETIRYFSQKLGVEFDMRCKDLARACFLVPQADVLYETDEYYKGISKPQKQDLTDFVVTEEPKDEPTENYDDFDSTFDEEAELALIARQLAEDEKLMNGSDSTEQEQVVAQPPAPVESSKTYHRVHEEDEDEFERIIRDYILPSKTDITAAEPDWFRVGCACYAVLGDVDGRYAFHAISKFYPAYSQRETDKKFNNISRHMYTQCGIGTLIYLCRQAGIMD